MAALPLNNHYPPVFVFINIFKQITNTVKSLLQINVGHASFVEILYLVVGLNHLSKDSITRVKYKRKKHKSNAGLYHKLEGGAVPTFTHQMITG